MAPRVGGRSVNHFSTAFGLVRKRPRSTTAPSSLSVRQWLQTVRRSGFFLVVGLWCFTGDFGKNGRQNVVFLW